MADDADSVSLSAGDAAWLARAPRWLDGQTRDRFNVRPVADAGRDNWTDPIAWPVKVTGDADPATGLYPGKLLYAVPDPEPGVSSTPAAWANVPSVIWVMAFPGQTLASGDEGVGRLVGKRVTGEGVGATTRAVYALPTPGGAGTGSGGSCGDGCGWVAGLRGGSNCPAFRGDCLLLTVLSAAGHCLCLNTGQSVTLSYSGGVWEGSPFATCVDESTTVRFDPDGCTGPCLTIIGGAGSGAVTYPLTLACCGNDYAEFVGPGVATGDLVCNHAWATQPPHNNTFRVRVEWVGCPNPDWGGSGWYCVGDPACSGSGSGITHTCENFAEDPGPCYHLCGGPYSGQPDCLADCGGWYCVGTPDCTSSRATKDCVRYDTPPAPDDPTICGGPYATAADCLPACDPSVPRPCCDTTVNIPTVLHWTLVSYTGDLAPSRTSGTMTWRTVADCYGSPFPPSAAWVDDTPGPTFGPNPQGVWYLGKSDYGPSTCPTGMVALQNPGCGDPVSAGSWNGSSPLSHVNSCDPWDEEITFGISGGSSGVLGSPTAGGTVVIRFTA